MSYQGKKNIYLCDKCGRGFVTLDVHDGVTPFLTSCLTDGCDSLARSLCYNVPQSVLASVEPAVRWIWVSPEPWMSPSVVVHLERGGLVQEDWYKRRGKRT